MSQLIAVINGPNLNLLGTREPGIYGSSSLQEIEERCKTVGAEAGVEVEFFQSNHEGVIIDFIQGAIDRVDGLVVNAAAYTHTSVAIHDALRAFHGPKVELHISNPHQREQFRHISFVASVSDAVIAGLGVRGYELATNAVANLLKKRANQP